jgi:hypothetical protein
MSAASRKRVGAADTLYLCTTLGVENRQGNIDLVADWRLEVVDGAPTIDEVDDRLNTEIFWAIDRGHQEAFLERLEGCINFIYTADSYGPLAENSNLVITV